MSGERKRDRASARSTTSACIDGALSWDKRSLQSAQYGAGSSGFQNASIKAGIALEATTTIGRFDDGIFLPEQRFIDVRRSQDEDAERLPHADAASEEVHRRANR